MPIVRFSVVMLLLAAAATPSFAEDWPARPVRIIVPVVAGGSTDVTARLLGEYLSRSLCQQFVVENRTGAAGMAGIEAVGKSAPDGYTVLVTTDRVASGPHVFKLSTDPSKDLAAVVQVSRQPVVLAVHPSPGLGR